MRILGGLVLLAVSAMALATPSAEVRREPKTKAPSPVQIAQAQPAAVLPAAQYFTAQSSSPFEQYKSYLTGRARTAGVREGTILSVIPNLRLNQRVMELDRAQQPTYTYGSYAPNYGPYLSRHITTSLINRGQARYSSHWPNLSRIQSQYGVDPSVIIAIYGKETSYGTVTGGFDLLEALATLGYEGRRRSFFEDEFIAALKLMDQGVQRWQLKGSYAGATGYPQFMPSVALRLRADGDGDGYADIWRNEDDAFASIARYLRDAGWKPNVPWGVPVRIPSTLNRSAIQSRLNPTRCPAVYRRHSRWLTVGEWRSLGIVPGGRGLPDTEMASLMETPGAYADGYLLTTNYRAILDYNCSNYYALSIGLLANAIARR
ncbi:lytic murein transglycosylase [Sphingomonas hankyongi]|uniref:Lytic murein transglycosylase n=1 Tax=Sphingomonas hankyongi TaxID=2908209 RepID=A0ABT0S4D2_9SPHN|nr:lytic murein transglycosylase [Sphingomonas hankyongi]MCL6730483.1 lytic murein transglycosylase [Sphingomonas hankyongi]